MLSARQTRVQSRSKLRAQLAASLVLLLSALPLGAQVAVPDLAGSGAARLMSFTGQISVLRDNVPWALNVGDTIQPQQVVVTGSDGYGMFQVADGSRFEVFPKSKVVFRANRGDWKELLEIMLGKIRVQIEHPGGLPNNNRVRSPSAVIAVRGTIFDVEVDEETENTLVLDEEGQVEVRHILRPGDTPRLLGPGEFVRVNRNEPMAQKNVDRNGLLQRAARALSDALYQAALNEARGGGAVARAGTAGVATTAGAPADTKNGPPAPSAPPPPPPAPPAPAPPAPPAPPK